MKKSIIAAGAASVALAAMPIVGAFAATSVTDNITLSVGDACTMTDNATAENTRTKTTNIAAASYGTVETPSFSVTCNGGAWKVTAVGAGAAGHTTDLYNSEKSASIATSTADLDGSTSGWAYKLAVTSAPTGVTNVASDWTQIPSAATVAVSATATAVSDLAITPSYKISVASGAATGSYEGAVTYTVSTGATI